MAAIDLKSLPTGTSYGKTSIISKEVDFSKDNAAASDVVTVFDIPARTQIVGAWLDVQTAEGATATVTIAAGGTTLFAALTDINAVAFLANDSVTATLTADTPVTITMANAAANAVIDLRVAVIDLNA